MCTFDKDSPLGKLEQWSKNVEEAGKKMEDAQKSGDQDAQAEAMKPMMGAALGGGQVEVAGAGSAEAVPARIARRNATRGRSPLSATRPWACRSRRRERRTRAKTAAPWDLQITDTGTAKGLLALAGWAGMEGENETSSGYEKTYRRGRSADPRAVGRRSSKRRVCESCSAIASRSRSNGASGQHR